MHGRCYGGSSLRQEVTSRARPSLWSPADSTSGPEAEVPKVLSTARAAVVRVYSDPRLCHPRAQSTDMNIMNHLPTQIKNLRMVGLEAKWHQDPSLTTHSHSMRTLPNLPALMESKKFCRVVRSRRKKHTDTNVHTCCKLTTIDKLRRAVQCRTSCRVWLWDVQFLQLPLDLHGQKHTKLLQVYVPGKPGSRYRA